ncbi:hypothetical protein FCM35_KLT09557 [Carex littledalei]|uniref:Uncharacterized protein n=1 Tax=Carex littledalei TaxID=544730 RepID=A0A833RIW8_9POAL|nr:hypothetical protein FCM35_KLT09557 [Carex littledalei]
MHPLIEGTSAAAAESTEIEGTSAANDPPMDEISDTEHVGPFSFLMDRLVEETSDAESTESGERTHWPKNSIFRVPEHIRYNRESNFEPKLVSIGPYYHGEENLERMEDLKIQCIQEIVKMLGVAATTTNQPRPLESSNRISQFYKVSEKKSMNLKSSDSINHRSRHEVSEKKVIDDVFLRQFMVSAREARAYYKEEFDYGECEFVKMLFLDSCFIIRTIFAFSQQTQSMSFLDVHIKEVRSDLLLLDNQIPLFFIKEVYEWFLSDFKDKKLPQFNAVLEPFIYLDMPWRINGDAKPSEAAHLLDLYWRYSLSYEMDMRLITSERYLSNSSEINLSNNALVVMASATELQQMAGIEFEKFKDTGHLDVTFSKGIMRMPRLKIDSRQIILLRNLIAFESCIIPSMRNISCYMKLMDALINSEKDVELLQNCGVIYNTLSSHEMAATFFNDIGDFCFTDDHTNRFSGLYKDVQKYYDSRWHRRLASLRHNYFSNPWTGISVVAAVILLILSVLQTFYAIYGYHHPKN